MPSPTKNEQSAAISKPVLEEGVALPTPGYALEARYPMNKPNSWSPQLEPEQDLSLQTTCEATLEQDVATGPESSNTTDGGAVPTSGGVQEQVQSLHKLCGDNLAQWGQQICHTKLVVELCQTRTILLWCQWGLESQK